MKVKVTQSCPTLCDPMDYTVHGILQAGILEWVAFPFSRESSQPRDQTQVSHIAGRFFTSWATREAQRLSIIIMVIFKYQLLYACVLGHVLFFGTLWTIAHQASLSIGFSRQEYWNVLPCPSPGDLPDPGIQPASPAAPASQADSLPLSHQGNPAITI